MLLGDVWAVIATIIGVAVSAWALLVCFALLFRSAAEQSRAQIERGPVRTFFFGLFLAVFVGGLGVVMAVSPLPLVKLAGSLVTLIVLATSFVGSAGLVEIARRRIQVLDPNCSNYTSMSRAALFIVLSTIMPILGWLLIAPVVFCLGLGAGTPRLFSRAQPAAVAS